MMKRTSLITAININEPGIDCSRLGMLVKLLSLFHVSGDGKLDCVVGRRLIVANCLRFDRWSHCEFISLVLPVSTKNRISVILATFSAGCPSISRESVL
jgi:hypothetical protein